VSIDAFAFTAMAVVARSTSPARTPAFSALPPSTTSITCRIDASTSGPCGREPLRFGAENPFDFA
jgi:hypothetical protein